ncbi:MAG: POTRA domain-containing protein [Blastocatellia bacterium]
MQYRNYLPGFLRLLALGVFLVATAQGPAATGHARQQNAPCVFDNFVWFKDQEIVSEIRKDLPSFDGTVPESGEPVRVIMGTLEKLLKSKKLPAEVGYNFSTGTEFQYRPEHVFTANAAKVNVCKVIFAGPGAAPEPELQQAAKALAGKPFSRIGARELTETAIIPVYRKYGHLRAVPRMPAGELDPACKNGVAVKIAVDPGVAYLWEKAVWSGAKLIPPAQLDQLLAMQAGEVASGQKLDAGLAAVVRAYGKQGYAGLQLQPAPEFNDAGRRVTLNIVVNEGPQFRMGALDVAGLSAASAAMFKELWRLKPGDVYDATYLGEFLKRLVDAGGIPADQVSRIKPAVKPDAQKRTVDVVIRF